MGGEYLVWEGKKNFRGIDLTFKKQQHRDDFQVSDSIDEISVRECKLDFGFA